MMKIGLNKHYLNTYAGILAFAVHSAALHAQAGVKFACFEIPGRPAQVFEYSNGSCGPSDKNRDALNMMEQRAGSHNVLCMYTAMCAPQEPKVKQVENLSRQQLDTLFHAGALKESVLVCNGRAQYSAGSQLTNPICPDVSGCSKDVYYNSSGYAPLTVPSQSIRSVLTPESEDGVL